MDFREGSYYPRWDFAGAFVEDRDRAVKPLLGFNFSANEGRCPIAEQELIGAVLIGDGVVVRDTVSGLGTVESPLWQIAPESGLLDL